MSRPKSSARKIVEEYVSKYKDLGHAPLSRFVYNKHPEAFRDSEQVRTFIRDVRGKIGNRNRKNCDKTHFETMKRSYNPYNLPASDEAEWIPYKMPKGCTRILCLSDVHIPYHNIEALTIALDYGKEKKVNGILLNGDILDFYGVSSFEKDPRKRHFAEELEMGRDFLKILKENFNCPIYYKLGNHEERYERYLKVKAPELLDVSEFRLENLLRFGEVGCNLIDEKRIIKIGSLNVMHGHEFGRSVFSPVNPARGVYMRAKESTIIGHHHQTSEHSEPSLNGKVVTTWSQGCLCELHPEYMPINKWNLGFSYIERKEDDYTVDNLRIVDGQIR